MATYEFTYKVPDQVYVDSWAEGKTATAKVKLDDPVIPLTLNATLHGVVPLLITLNQRVTYGNTTS